MVIVKFKPNAFLKGQTLEMAYTFRPCMVVGVNRTTYDVVTDATAEPRRVSKKDVYPMTPHNRKTIAKIEKLERQIASLKLTKIKAVRAMHNGNIEPVQIGG